jgi:hypothetical protein
MLLFPSTFSSLMQKRYSVSLLKRLDHGVKWLCWTQAPKVRTPNPSSERRSGARCRVRTYKSLTQHQQLTLVDPQIDPQNHGIEKQQLAHLVKAWPNLSITLKRAILMIAGAGADQSPTSLG